MQPDFWGAVLGLESLSPSINSCCWQLPSKVAPDLQWHCLYSSHHTNIFSCHQASWHELIVWYYEVPTQLYLNPKIIFINSKSLSSVKVVVRTIITPIKQLMYLRCNGNWRTIVALKCKWHHFHRHLDAISWQLRQYWAIYIREFHVVHGLIYFSWFCCHMSRPWPWSWSRSWGSVSWSWSWSW